MGLETVVDGTGTGYGLLGSMRGAGAAKEVFNKASPVTLRTRERIRSVLQPVLHASPKAIPGVAVEFIRSVGEIRGFSGAVATRLLALARPELAVTVNSASQD